MTLAATTVHSIVATATSVVMLGLPGLWTYRAYTGKRAWPGPGKVPRIHLRGEPSKNAAPFPSIAVPLFLEVAYLFFAILLDQHWHINFAGTGPRQQTASQDILGAIAVIPIAVVISLGVSGRPRFLIPRQYKTKDGLNPDVVAMTRADAPFGSAMGPWFREHPAWRLAIAAVTCGAAMYYSAVSLNHVLAHRATPPLWSLVLATAYAMVWIVIATTGDPAKKDESGRRRIGPPWMPSQIVILLVLPLLVAFSNWPSHSDNAPPVPISLQVVGKTAMFFGALAIVILTIRHTIDVKRGTSPH